MACVFILLMFVIIKAFVNNDIGKIAYTVNDEEKFSVAYIDGRLVFENEYLD